MSLKVKKYNVVLELAEPMLGTVPKTRDVFTTYIQGKAREEIERAAKKGLPLADGTEATPENIAARLAEEPETVADLEEKGWTGFFTDTEGPFLYDYHIKGFLSEAARMLKEAEPDDAGGKTIKQLGDKVKRYLFVRPRRIRLCAAASEPLERPIRAMTAQGPRVALVRSDLIEAGAKIAFQIHLLHGGGLTESMLRDLLEYGEYMGLGQWRSGGYGSFRLFSLVRE